MDAKHTPATPLPWNVAGGSLNIIKNGGVKMHAECRGADGDDNNAANAAYIAHAANAYPKLIKALRSMNHMGGDERGGYCICPRNDGSAPDAKHATGCADARALLRELGEE